MRILFIWTLLLAPLVLSAQRKGMKVVDYYGSEDYQAANNNWYSLQNKDGIMFFANSKGVLEFDGKEWTHIPVTNEVVRSLDSSVDGTIYVGSMSNFGYLKPSATGQLTYVSLSDSLLSDHLPFTEIMSVNAGKGKVFFHDRHYIFRYSKGKIDYWPTHDSYHRSYLFDDILYFRQDSLGFCRLKGDTIEPIPQGEIFVNEFISGMMPMGDGSFLLASRTQGLFRFFPAHIGTSKPSIEQFKTEIDSELSIKGGVYHGKELTGYHANERLFALSLLGRGIAILRPDGTLYEQYSHPVVENGEMVLSVNEGRNGGLWLTLSNGILHLKNYPYITPWKDTEGLRGNVYSSAIFHNSLYIGTALGLFKKEGDQFIALGANREQTWAFAKWTSQADSSLLMGTNSGIYRIKDRDVRQLFDTRYILSLAVSPKYPGILFAGSQDHLSLLKMNSVGSLEEYYRIPEISGQISKIEVDEEGEIWVAQALGKIYRLVPTENGAFKKISLNDLGIPPHPNTFLFKIGRSIVVSNPSGIFGFSRSQQKFVAFESIKSYFEDGSLLIFSMWRDKDGSFYFDSNRGKGGWLNAGGTYQFYNGVLNLMGRSNEFQSLIFTDADAKIWFASSTGLFQYHPEEIFNEPEVKAPLLRKIFVKGDSLIYSNYSVASRQSKHLQLPYEFNSIILQYVSPQFHSKFPMRYRHRLIGFTNEWSEWTTEYRRELNNLKEGTYRFEVESMDVFGRVSPTQQFHFAILPPWYRSAVAYVLYVVFFAGFVWMVIALNTRRLRMAKRQLEGEVSLRTKEIEEKNQQLQEQHNDLMVQKDLVEQSFENVKLLSDIGIRITSSLSSSKITEIVYDSVNSLMDASAFGIGLFNEAEQRIEFNGLIEKGKALPFYHHGVEETNRLSVWCFNHRREVIINDIDTEYEFYVKEKLPAVKGDNTCSIIYLPLIAQTKPIGVLTVQSFERYAYSDFHVSILKNLAVYIAIALENANAYKNILVKNSEIEMQKNEIEAQRDSLENAAFIIENKNKELRQANASLEEKVAERTSELNDAYRDLDGFIYRSSHNLKGPVARLLGLAYLAKLETKDPTAQDYLEKIQHSAQEMDRILSRLIKTRELSYTEPQIHKINLLTVVDSTWQAVVEESDSTGIQFINALNADLIVPTDPDLLENLLKILLHNSIQYSDPTKDNRFIKIDLEERKKGFVNLRVQDNGIGITPGSEEKIFDMFYVGTDYHNGTGLGLYEATIIVKKLKGRIFLSSSESQTTCFEIELPKK